MNAESRLNAASWETRNEGYLSAALEWLRLKLTQAGEINRSKAKELGKKKKKQKNGDKEIAGIAVVVEELAGGEPPPALVLLSRRLGMSAFERDLLLLCIAMELDTRIPALCAHAQESPQLPYPTFALAMTLFDSPAWDVLSPLRPLRYWRLLEINQHSTGVQSLISSPLRADQRIVDYIKGLNYLDNRLTPHLVPFDVEAGETDLSPSQQDATAVVNRILERAMASGNAAVVQLTGTDSVSKQVAAQLTATNLGLALYRLPVELLPARAEDLEIIGRLWQRESALLPVSMYLDAHEPGVGATSEAGRQPAAQPLNRFLSRTDGVFFISSRDIRSDLGTVTQAVEIKKPIPAEQQAVWNDWLGTAAPESPPLLAGQFNLNVPAIRRIVTDVAAEPRDNGRIPHQRLWATCLINTGPKLDLLAQRIEPKATWEDIVLSRDAMDLLQRIAAQVGHRSKVYDGWGFRKRMNRGLGINALFAGDSGTGKTMAAEVIANHLQLNLYRIDLSGVVSKYIGETEKNLRQLFDAAEDGGAILFFDEADALFGKRSEVKDSHDRYANIEINYLLQRMESYNGLAILATNMKSALDDAFTRRLRFIVNFPFPGVRERKLIFQRMFPEEVPRGYLDYDRLARFNLTGGSISNIAINAAFMAADKGDLVTMPDVLAATRAEFRKMERPVKESDFHWEEPGGSVT